MSGPTDVSIALVASPGKMTKRTRATLTALDAEMFPDDDPQELEGAYWWTATDGKKVAGFAGLRYADYADRGFLCLAGVVSGYRRRGIHRRLIAVRERRARVLGWSRLITYASILNVGSLNSLVSAGYRFYIPECWPGGVSMHLYKNMEV